MYGYMYRDLIVNRKNLIIFYVAVLWVNLMEFIAADGDTSPALSMLVNTLAVVSSYFIIGNAENELFSQDQTKKWASSVTAAENGIAKYVGGKYLLIMAMTMFTTILCNLINAISVDFAHNGFSVTVVCYILFYFQLFLRALDIPFIMAFGSKHGGAVKAVILLIIVLAVIVYLLFGDLSAIGLDSMDTFWDKFTGLMSSENSPKVMSVISILGLAVLPLYYASYRLSCKLYLRGVDSFES